MAHKSATEATPQRAATAAKQWADEGPTPADFSVRALGHKRRPYACREFSSGTTLMGEKTPAREEAGELPSPKDEWVSSAASTGGGVLKVDFTLLMWQPRHIDQSAEALPRCRSREGRGHQYNKADS